MKAINETRLLMSPDTKISRRAITCRCSIRFIVEVPQFVLDADEDIAVLATCRCGQNYGLVGEDVIRLNQDQQPESGEPLLRSDQPSSNDDFLEGKIVQPTPKGVN